MFYQRSFDFTYETHTFALKYSIDQRVHSFILANETIRPNKVYIEETLTKARALPESRVKMSILIFLRIGRLKPSPRKVEKSSISELPLKTYREILDYRTDGHYNDPRRVQDRFSNRSNMIDSILHHYLDCS